METAEKELKKLVDEFNEMEKKRYGDTARLREFKSLDMMQSGIPQHHWQKKSLHGEYNKYGTIVDFWECLHCGLIREVATLDGVPYMGDCFPERTCRYHQKVFKTVKNFNKHYLNFHSDY